MISDIISMYPENEVAKEAAHKKPSKEEVCISETCTTPNCPFRPKRRTKKTLEEGTDFSRECGYYAISGDGRWTKPFVWTEGTDKIT